MTLAVLTLPCPACEEGAIAAEHEPFSQCSNCTHTVNSDHVAEAIALATYINTAQARRDWLLAQIVAGYAPSATSAPKEREASSARSGLFALGGVLLGLAGVFFLALAWSALPLPGRAGLILVTSSVLVGTGHRLTNRLRSTAETLTSVGVVLAVMAGIAAPDLFGFANGWETGARSLWYAMILTVAALAAALTTPRSVLRSWPVLTSTFAVTAAACATVSVSGQGHLWLVALVAGLAGTVLHLTPTMLPRLLVRLDTDRFLLNGQAGNLLRTAGTLHLTAAALIALCGTFGSERAATAGTILAVSAAPLLIVHFAPSRAQREHALLTLGTGVGAATSLAAYDLLNAYAATFLTALALTGLVTLARVPRIPEAAIPALVITGLTGLILSAATTGPMSPTVALAALAGTLALTATTGTTTTLPWRHSLWAAAIAATSAWWTWLTMNDITLPVEGWTMPAAGAVLAAGTAWAWRTGRTPRWHHTDQWLLPGLLALGAPGAFAAMAEIVTAEDTNLTWRAPVYLISGAIVAAIGGRARISALLKAGTTTVVLASIDQITTLGRALPGWVTLGVAGVLVLTAAARWEWLQAQSRRSKEWADTLR